MSKTFTGQITIGYDDYTEYTYKIPMTEADAMQYEDIILRAEKINSDPPAVMTATFENDYGGHFSRIQGITIIEEEQEVVYGHAL